MASAVKVGDAWPGKPGLQGGVLKGIIISHLGRDLFFFFDIQFPLASSFPFFWGGGVGA